MSWMLKKTNLYSKLPKLATGRSEGSSTEDLRVTFEPVLPVVTTSADTRISNEEKKSRG
ncbi:hypothetical protein V7O67_06975 [Methanolobus sp. ZRKC4]|uniref:hypothetical protein n=2 Tax=unclassified Methanolobus TaxID=2629569 RepID=UPI00324CEB30